MSILKAISKREVHEIVSFVSVVPHPLTSSGSRLKMGIHVAPLAELWRDRAGQLDKEKVKMMMTLLKSVSGLRDRA